LDLIALIPLYALCALPTIGWLMLCSAWARSMPFLWALVIPLASNLIVFWLHLLGLWDLNGLWYFGHITSRLLFSVTPGNWWHFIAPTSLNGVASHNDILDALNLAQNYSALTSIEMWAEAVAGVAMIGAAIWLRRWRDDS
jgi:ABC-2 type transport system permease protein